MLIPETVLRQAQDGDAEAARRLFRAYAPVLHAAVARYFAAEDEAGEAFRRAAWAVARGLRGLHHPEAADGWFWRMAFRQAWEALRAQPPRPAPQGGDADAGFRRLLGQALAAQAFLPAAALAAHTVEGRGDAEAGERLGIDPAKVAPTAERARERLAGWLSGRKLDPDEFWGRARGLRVGPPDPAWLDRVEAEFLDLARQRPAMERFALPMGALCTAVVLGFLAWVLLRERGPLRGARLEPGREYTSPGDYGLPGGGKAALSGDVYLRVAEITVDSGRLALDKGRLELNGEGGGRRARLEVDAGPARVYTEGGHLSLDLGAAGLSLRMYTGRARLRSATGLDTTLAAGDTLALDSRGQARK